MPPTQALVLGLLLLVVFGLFSKGVQNSLRQRLHTRPALVFATPTGLSVIFCLLAANYGALSLPLVFLISSYTFAPAVCAFVQGPGYVKKPTGLDFGIILLLWLPLEFGAGQHLIPRPVQGFLHSVAYGIAIILALVLFLGFRSFPGLKYNVPARVGDLAYPLIGFALTAPVLIILGRWLDFIPPFHLPSNASAAKLLGRFLVILAGTAIPEEILFRSLIQNLLMQRFGSTTRMLLVAGFIFGCAHLDNGPQPLPNWRYMILATIAGVAYGKVFQKASTVLSSAGFHALVDATKHIFF